MAYQLIIRHAVKHRAYTDKRPFKLWGGMLHSVGCNQPSAHNWADRWNRATAPVVANYVTEPDLAIETLPPNKRPWTSGSGKNGNANDFMFQVEMAEPASLKYGNGGKFTVSQDKLLEAKDYVKRNYETAVKLFADTFKENGLDPLGKMPNGYPTIMSHAEGAKYGIASNHGDPEHLWRQLNLPFSMDTFRRDVKLAMSATPTPPKAETVRLTAGTPYYKAPDGKTVAGKIEVTTNYTIVEHSGNYGRLKSGAGWVRLADEPAPPPTPTLDDKIKAWDKANTLKLGSKGKTVEVLQRALAGKGYNVVVIDGDFGSVTDREVRKYQTDNKLFVDGIVGPQTWEVIMR